MSSAWTWKSFGKVVSRVAKCSNTSLQFSPQRDASAIFDRDAKWVWEVKIMHIHLRFRFLHYPSLFFAPSFSHFDCIHNYSPLSESKEYPFRSARVKWQRGRAPVTFASSNRLLLIARLVLRASISIICIISQRIYSRSRIHTCVHLATEVAGVTHLAPALNIK